MASTTGSGNEAELEIPGGYDDPEKFEELGAEVDYGSSLVRPEDIEKTIPDEQKPHLDASRGDAYWLEKGFSLALVYFNTNDKEYKYYVVTPFLHAREQLLIKYLQQKLVNELEFAEMPLDMSREERQRQIQRTINSLLLRTGLADRGTIQGTENYYSVVDEDESQSDPDSTIIQKALRFFSGKKLESKTDDEEPEEFDADEFENIEDVEQVEEIESKELEDEVRGLAPLSERQIDKLLYYIVREQVGYGKIQPLLDDPNIEDISVDGYDSNAWVYHSEFTSVQTNIKYHERDLDETINYIAEADGKGISKRQPQINAVLEDGSRAQLTLGEEVSEQGSNFTIRVFKEVPFTPVDLIHWHTYSIEQMAYLWLVVENQHHMIFAGKTASGKTTTLNACSLFIPVRKVVSIEDTPELSLPHKHWIQETTREHHGANDIQDYGMDDLLKASLRQRPEYILIGEVRGEEAADTLFEAAKTGHTTKTTFHAGDTRAAISRFTDDLNTSPSEFREIDLVIVQDQYHKDGERQRRAQEITEVVGFDDDTGKVETRTIFEWDQADDMQVRTSQDSKIIDDIKTRKGWSEKELETEIERRGIVLSTLITEGIQNYEDVSAVIQAYMRDPEAVLGYCANGEIRERLSELTSLESLKLDVDEKQEDRISRPFSQDRFDRAQRILKQNEDLIEEARDYDFSTPKEDLGNTGKGSVNEKHDNSEGSLNELSQDDVGESKDTDSTDPFKSQGQNPEDKSELGGANSVDPLTAQASAETGAGRDSGTTAEQKRETETQNKSSVNQTEDGSVFIEEGESVELEESKPSTESDAPKPEVTEVETETEKPEENETSSDGKWFSWIRNIASFGDSSEVNDKTDTGTESSNEESVDSTDDTAQTEDDAQLGTDLEDSENETQGLDGLISESESSENETQGLDGLISESESSENDHSMQAEQPGNKTAQQPASAEESPTQESPEPTSERAVFEDASTSDGKSDNADGKDKTSMVEAMPEATREQHTLEGSTQNETNTRDEPREEQATFENQPTTENDIFAADSENSPEPDQDTQTPSETGSVTDEFGSAGPTKEPDSAPESEVQSKTTDPTAPVDSETDAVSDSKTEHSTPPESTSDPESAPDAGSVPNKTDTESVTDEFGPGESEDPSAAESNEPPSSTDEIERSAQNEAPPTQDKEFWENTEDVNQQENGSNGSTQDEEIPGRSPFKSSNTEAKGSGPEETSQESESSTSNRQEPVPERQDSETAAGPETQQNGHSTESNIDSAPDTDNRQETEEVSEEDSNTTESDPFSPENGENKPADSEGGNADEESITIDEEHSGSHSSSEERTNGHDSHSEERTNGHDSHSEERTNGHDSHSEERTNGHDPHSEETNQQDNSGGGPDSIPFDVPNALKDDESENNKEETADDGGEDESTLEEYELIAEFPDTLELTPEQREEFRQKPIIGAKFSEIEQDERLCSKIEHVDDWDLYRQCLCVPTESNSMCSEHADDEGGDGADGS